DSHVGKHIFEEVISSNQGILREKTRVLVTNALYVLPLVDEVILLKNGTIAATGSCQKLSKENEAFKELMDSYHPTHNQNDQHQNVQNSINRQHSKVDEQHTVHQRPRFYRQITSESLLSDTASISSISTLESLEEEINEVKLIETESVETGYISWSVYKKFFRSLTTKWIILCLTAYALYTISNSGANFWLSFWTDRIDREHQDHGYELWIYFAIGILQLFFIAIGWCSIVMGCLYASRTLHERLLSNIVHAPMYFFDTTPLGRIMNRFSRD
ncbi:hypothetical protein BLA29_008869, partial [Euroglyphus maynei]